MALLLRRQGITRIRPLLGGLDAWRNLGYPLQNIEAELTATVTTVTTVTPASPGK